MNSDGKGLLADLVRRGLLTENQARVTTDRARQQSRSTVAVLISDGLLPQEIIAANVARLFSLPLLDLRVCRPLLNPLTTVARELLDRHKVLPLAVRNGRLVLALADPAQTQAIKDIEFHTGKPADLVVAPYDHLIQAIAALTVQRVSPTAMLQALTALPVDVPAEQEGNELEQALTDANDAPVIRAVNQVLRDAIDRGASDIHVEPYEQLFRIRFRVDGLLRQVADPPISSATRLIARLKIMAALDISERRMPQDGRIRLRHPDRPAVDFRVSTLPTLWGEKIVLRVIDPLRANLQLTGLGLTQPQEALVNAALSRPQGLVLVTGPTGSGKSVTLYSALQRLNDNRRNIATAEDPVELNLSGINQVQIKPAIGLTFAVALRAFLRQDPDVLMVGEIRDLETAEIAIKAAQTGHLVLSTLHTNSATETIVRLLSMGLQTYDLASSLSLIVAQRLVRRLCERCKEAQEMSASALRVYGVEGFQSDSIRLFRAKGCDRCHEGYLGRIGIYEVVPINEVLSRTIIAGGNSREIAAQARQAGYDSLRQSAVKRMTEGLTSLKEVIRVT